MKNSWQFFLVVLFLMAINPALAGVADVVNAKAVCSQDATCNFTVTVKHDDSGWDHYANQ